MIYVLKSYKHVGKRIYTTIISQVCNYRGLTATCQEEVILSNEKENFMFVG